MIGRFLESKGDAQIRPVCGHLFYASIVEAVELANRKQGEKLMLGEGSGRVFMRVGRKALTGDCQGGPGEVEA